VASVAFSDDAASIVVLFNADTDMGGQEGGVLCDTLLTFAQASALQCQWTDARRLVIYPSVDVLIGDVVLVLADTIRAQCAPSSTPCQDWATVTPDAAVGAISTPADPVTPEVALSYAATLGACGALLLDLSASSGAGGRPWAQPVFTLETSPAGVDTSALAAFFTDSYEIASPSPATADLLVAGTEYTIEVTLCNFLGGCGSATAVVQVATADSVPVVSFQGSPTRSVPAYEALSVAVRAYTADCNGTKSSAHLTYRWRVAQYGEYEVSSLVSTSVDPKKLKLPGYSLEPGSWYTIRVQVIHNDMAGSTTDAFASVVVSVPRGLLVARIFGGAERSIRLGELLELDGSESFDEDIQGLTGSALDAVSFTWSCIQLLPTYSSSCPFAVSGKSYDATVCVADARNMSSGVDTKLRVTLMLSEGSRSASRFVDLVLVETLTPAVLVQQSDTLVDPAAVLRLSGSVTSTAPCTGLWNISGTTMSLTAVAQTPTQVYIPAGAMQRPVYLAIQAGVLTSRSGYRFTLTCGAGSASVDITTNGPPQYGVFTISPSVGIERSTSFSMRTSQWFDAHMPLTFQFEYFSTAGLRIVLQSRSERAFAASQLPAGTNAGFNVSCRVVVFDALGASAALLSPVTVTSVPIPTIEQLSVEISSELGSASGDLDATRQVISLYASVLNIVNCSFAPNCTSVGRLECGTKSHTCGDCLTGRIGDSGPGNGVCLSTEELFATQNAAPDTVFANKSCTGDCGGKGMCTFVDSRSLRTLSFCATNDITCTGVCVCETGFSGDSCSIDDVDLAETVNVRTSLISNLLTLTVQEDPSDEAVGSWVAGALLLSQKGDEMTAESANSVLDIASAAITAATALGAHPDSVADVLAAVDSAGGVMGKARGSGALSEAGVSKGRAIMNSLGALVLGSLVAGETPFVSRQASTKMTAVVATATGDEVSGVQLQLTVPQSEQQAAYGEPTSSIGIELDDDSGTSVVELATTVTETNAFQFGEISANFTANPLNVLLRTDSTDGTSFVILYRNLRPVEYFNHSLPGNATTQCPIGLSSTNILLCPGGVQVVHQCNGTALTLVTLCPVIVVAPACQILASDDNSGACTVVNYTALTTTCRCTVTARRRRLGAVDSVRSIQAVTVLESVVADFTTTLGTVPTSEKAIVQTLEGSIIVITMFGVFWFVGLSMMAYFLSGAVQPARGNANSVFPMGAAKADASYTGSATVAPFGSTPVTTVAESVTALREYVRMLIPPVRTQYEPMLCY